MATDPNMSDDQKRRQRERESGGLRRVIGDLAAFRSGGPAMARGALTRINSGATAQDLQDTPVGTLAGLVVAPAAQMARNRERNAEETTPPRQPAAVPQRRANRFNVPGLTRVTKTADGVYTDDPSAQGDVRYYDQTGMRADTGVPQGITRNTTVDEYNAAERAAALDPTDPAAQQQIIARGQRSIGLMRRLQEESAERAANAGSWITGEDGQRRIYTAEEVANGVAPAQGGGLRRGSAGAKNPTTPDWGDIINAKKFEFDIATDKRDTAFEREKYADERFEQAREELSENPQQFIKQFLGALRGMSEEQRVEQLRTPEGRLIMAAVTDQGRASQDGGLFRDTPISDIRLEDFEPAFFGGMRVAGDEFISDTFDPTDPEGLGLAKEDWETLVRLSASGAR